MTILEQCDRSLKRSGIEVQLFHPEACPGQYEFVLPPQPPLAAIDTLIAARGIISTIASRHNLRATLMPKPLPERPGTGAHTHISIDPPDGYEMFYAGILKHLQAITAFTYPCEASYDRVADGCWAGGTWVAWGTQNREAPLRKIEGSHWEVKCMDGLANPYLALSAILGAGLNGISVKEPLEMKDCQQDPASLDSGKRKTLGINEALPKSFAEAVKSLKANKVLEEVMGKDAITLYLGVKQAEGELAKTMSSEGLRKWMIETW